MAFQVSPGIYTSEYDITQRATSVVTGAGAIAGIFSTGPVDIPTFITSEKQLVKKFGPPTDSNYETWYTAADFLAYSNSLWVTRVTSNTIVNAVTTGTPGRYSSATEAIANNTIGTLIARHPGVKGNSLKISICPGANGWSSANNSIANISIDIGAKFGTVDDYAELAAGDILQVKDSKGNTYNLNVTDASSANVQFSNKYNGTSSLSNATGTRRWGYFQYFGSAPSANQVHIVIVDEDGLYSSASSAHAPGFVLEQYNNVSVVPGVRPDGTNKYYKDQINHGYGTNTNKPSQYVFATGATISATGSAVYASLAGGIDGNNATERDIQFSELANAYSVYADKKAYDIRYILQGKARGSSYNEGLANYIIDNVCEVRKDCMVFITPSTTNTDTPQVTTGSELDQLQAFRNALSNSSYAVLDSGYKYRIDIYNNVNRWTPLNGDIAGLVARTAIDKDPWYSPAGYNRGKIKNVIKLAFNPNEAQRDILYPIGINPVITQSGEGTLLFGDKTLQNADTAFDHINVRMLFITIEQAIQKASKASLFEFNDAFTRAQFRNIVEPYLRDVQGRRGIYDFKVVCDETNNTPEVIDDNTFIADIYVKPARSINYIKLNFVAVPTGTSFDEVVGNF